MCVEHKATKGKGRQMATPSVGTRKHIDLYRLTIIVHVVNFLFGPCYFLKFCGHLHQTKVTHKVIQGVDSSRYSWASQQQERLVLPSSLSLPCLQKSYPQKSIKEGWCPISGESIKMNCKALPCSTLISQLCPEVAARFHLRHDYFLVVGFSLWWGLLSLLDAGRGRCLRLL